MPRACTVAMRRPNAAAAATVVVLLWLAVLTAAFHGCGRIGCGRLLARRTGSVVAAAVPARRMMLDVTSFDTAVAHSSVHHHHHHHQHHHQDDQHHQHHHHVHRWNRKGIPPSTVGKGEEIDPRYGVEKRLVPTGPNPLHH